MDERPLSIWKRPLGSRRARIVLFTLLVCVLWGIGCFILAFNNARLTFPTVGLAFLGAAAAAAILWVLCFLGRCLASWRNFRWLLIGLGCVALLIVLAYLEEDLRGKLAWQKHVKEMETKAEKMNIKAFVPPAVSDDKNFAFTPLLKVAHDFAHTGEGVIWRDTNGLARLEHTDPELKISGRTNKLVLGNIEKGTFADLAACADFYRGNTNYPQTLAPQSPATTIMTALGRFESEFQDLREANTARPLARFPIQYDYEPSWGILLPHLAHIKRLAKLFQVDALAKLEASRPTEAFDDLNLELRLSDSLRDEPLLIDHFVRIAALEISLQTVREGLFRHLWTAEQLIQIQSRLESLNLLAEYKWAMRGERAFSMEVLDYLRRQHWRSSTEVCPDDTAQLISRLMPGGWFYQNMVVISGLHQKFTLRSVDEKARRVYPEIVAQESRALRAIRLGPYTFFVGLVFPSLERASRKTARAQTYVDAASAACAIERFRLKKGALPEALEEMIPEFIQHIPNDVIDGKPLRYVRKADKGYLLYSIGWNGTDEGGTLYWRTDSRTPTLDLEAGDWVWQMKENDSISTR